MTASRGALKPPYIARVKISLRGRQDLAGNDYSDAKAMTGLAMHCSKCHVAAPTQAFVIGYAPLPSGADIRRRSSWANLGTPALLRTVAKS